MAIITGSWRNTTLVCGKHQNTSNPPVMELQLRQGIPTYCCPKCNILACEDDEPVCNNRLSVNEYEKMLSYIATVISDADEAGESPNLTNFQWSRRNLRYRVLQHKDNAMTISVNDKSLPG